MVRLQCYTTQITSVVKINNLNYLKLLLALASHTGEHIKSNEGLQNYVKKNQLSSRKTVPISKYQ